MKAIVVDDDPVCRTRLARLLESLGWEVARFADGPSALEALALDGADLLVTDVQMPEMDGPALADAARRLDPGQPILFVSGHASGVGFQGARFLPKPVQAEDLRETLAALPLFLTPGPRSLTGPR